MTLVRQLPHADQDQRQDRHQRRRPTASVPSQHVPRAVRHQQQQQRKVEIERTVLEVIAADRREWSTCGPISAANRRGTNVVPAPAVSDHAATTQRHP